MGRPRAWTARGERERNKGELELDLRRMPAKPADPPFLIASPRQTPDARRPPPVFITSALTLPLRSFLSFPPSHLPPTLQCREDTRSVRDCHPGSRHHHATNFENCVPRFCPISILAPPICSRYQIPQSPRYCISDSSSSMLASCTTPLLPLIPSADTRVAAS